MLGIFGTIVGTVRYRIYFNGPTDPSTRQYLLYIFREAIYNVYFHPLSKFPGPKLYAASPIPISWHMLAGDIGFKVKDLNEKYGEVVRIAPDELAFTSAAAVRGKVPHLKGRALDSDLDIDIYTRQPAKDDKPGRPAMQKSPKLYLAPPGGVHRYAQVLSTCKGAHPLI